MSFVSWQYAIFLLVVFAAYWRLPARGRLWLLVFASYFFYGAWDARFLGLLLTTTTIDFYCGLAIKRERRSLTEVILAACMPVTWLSLYTAFSRKPGAVEGWIIGAAAIFPIFLGALYWGLWRLPSTQQRRAFLLLSVLTNLGVL